MLVRLNYLFHIAMCLFLVALAGLIPFLMYFDITEDDLVGAMIDFLGLIVITLWLPYWFRDTKLAKYRIFK